MPKFTGTTVKGYDSAKDKILLVLKPCALPILTAL